MPSERNQLQKFDNVHEALAWVEGLVANKILQVIYNPTSMRYYRRKSNGAWGTFERYTEGVIFNGRDMKSPLLSLWWDGTIYKYHLNVHREL